METFHQAEASERHVVQRMRHDSRRRVLTVTDIISLTPKMLRIAFHSPELTDFVSLGADDHVKIFLPDGAGGTLMRDYTPRAFDTAAGTLIVDFALHEAGPATAWAIQAKLGDELHIGGPRGSQVVPDDFDWYLLIADETGIAAIGRRLEGLRSGVAVTTVIIVDDLAETQSISTPAAWTPLWVCREGQPLGDAELLRKTLERLELPAGDGYIWIAAEASVAKTLRGYFLDERRHPPRWLRASGYWLRGEAGAHENFG